MNMARLCVPITPENCRYRGEGNQGLVVRLVAHDKGDSIIRLIKDEVSCKKTGSSSNLLEHLEDYIIFVKHVMQPLLGKDIVCHPGIISLCAEEVKAINSIVNAFRPAFRCSKAVQEVDMHALVFPDFCTLPQTALTQRTSGPVLSVEIKPKHGIIANQRSHFSKSPLCNFCMMQFHKIQKGLIQKVGGYCPTDLFSGCPEKMEHAIYELFKTPQNNLRIFKDQNIVFSEDNKIDLNMIFHDFFASNSDDKYMSRITTLIMKVLLKPLSDDVHPLDSQLSNSEELQCSNSLTECSHMGETYCHKLPRNCILERILKMQSLDNMNIKAIHLFYRHLKQISHSCDYNKYNRMIGILPVSQMPLYLGKKFKMPNESEIHFESRKVWEFLLALTMKDCSLLLTFKCLESDLDFDKILTDFSDENIIADDCGNYYLFSLAAIDLDFKCIDTIEKIYNRRKNIKDAYSHTLKCTSF